MTTQCLSYDAILHNDDTGANVTPRVKATMLAWLSARSKQWLLRRQQRRMSRMLESLPEAIRHDIGWPDVTQQERQLLARRRQK